MKKIKVIYLSKEPHISQILTGFCMLSRGKGGYHICLEDHTEDCKYLYHTAIVEVVYMDRILIYDMMDGYQNPDVINYYLRNCDYYFKRSYSEKKNNELFLPVENKMYPLGFNYHVSCWNHPIDKHIWKEKLKSLVRVENDVYNNKSTFYNVRLFEEIPQYKENCFIVLFMTRLWEPEPLLSDEVNDERRAINERRIDIIRKLKSLKGCHFIGGLDNSEYTKKMAPDLIMPLEYTYRKKYIEIMHKSDICIGSMGLHESIGWKTGEYIAAAKGIVNERFRYEVPGDFTVGKNYFDFDTSDQCIEYVKLLLRSPQKLYEMKKANQDYYQKYLRPDMLIRNTLDIVENDMKR